MPAASAPLVYVSSKGEEIDPEDMHLARFANALRQIERMGHTNENYPRLEALRAVFERRQKEWDDQHPNEAAAAGRR